MLTGLAGGGTAPPFVFGVACGTVGESYFTLTFSIREAHWNMAYEYSECGIISYQADLTRLY